MSTTTDPFTMTEDALWWALDAHPAIISLVRVQSRVRYTGDATPRVLESPLTNDLPELVIQSQSNQANSQNSSSSHGMTRRYVIGIVTGDLRASGEVVRRAGLHQVHWAVQRALWPYRAGFPDLRFTNKVAVLETSESIAPADADVRAPGWQAACIVEVWFQFSDIDMEDLR